ncbi:MAG: enoyl-CoA hydratase [Bacteroidetes bacterium 47-18]|nr:MAG: enoyl-CoA hydratase [Bacteroidetes bacterium 47-18]
MSQAYVNISVREGVGEVVFFHPSGNSLPGEILNRIAAGILELGQDAEVKVIVLKSDGAKAFCAGASFDELMAIDNEEKGKVFFSGFARVINAIRVVPKFVIARVQGKAVGGGVGIAAAADYTIATAAAAVKLSELAVGIGPFVVGPAVERKMGNAAFTQLAIDATQWRDARFAQQFGLYAEVYETVEEVDAAVEALCDRLKASSPEAMADLKKVFWEGTEHWDTLLVERAAVSGKLVLSDFTRNAIQKFKSK